MKDQQGRFRTLSLFWEYRNENYEPIFTLKDEDFVVEGQTYTSLKRLYLQIADITEYDFAVQVLGAWDHWKKICNNKMLLPYIIKWRDELEMKLTASALRAVVAIAESPSNKGQLSAAKYLAERGWESKRGRPSKEEVVRQQKIHSNVMDDLQDDFDRVLGITH